MTDWLDRVHFGDCQVTLGRMPAGIAHTGAVLDPFFGSGTTGQVAQQVGRRWIGCELNPDYEPLQRERVRQPGLLLEACEA